MNDEHRDDAAPERVRADDYSPARIGAAAALTIVLVALLVLDVVVPGYDVSPGTLLPLLGAILALLLRSLWPWTVLRFTGSPVALAIDHLSMPLVLCGFGLTWSRRRSTAGE